MLLGGFLPEGKVGLVLLFTHAAQVAAGVLDVLQRTARESSILVFLVVFLDIKVDAAVRLVGKTVIDNLFHQLLLLDDMARSMGLNRRWQHIQCLHGLMVAVGVVLGNLHRLQLFQSGFLLNLVVTLVGIMLQMAHVGDVAHVAHLVAEVFQISEKDVERDGRTGMSEMGITIDRGTANIHPHMGCVQRLEAFLLPMQGIVNQKCLFHIF